MVWFAALSRIHTAQGRFAQMQFGAHNFLVADMAIHFDNKTNTVFIVRKDDGYDDGGGLFSQLSVCCLVNL